MRASRIVWAALALVMLAGCATAAPAPEPSVTSPPAQKPQAMPFEPDLLLIKVFPDTDGSPKTCEIRIAAVADPATGDTDDTRLSAAHSFLRDGDWSDVDVALDQIPPDELATAHDRGLGDAEVLMSALSEHVIDDVRAAGFVGDGVSVQVYNRCLGS